jgi:hypothetical protein
MTPKSEQRPSSGSSSNKICESMRPLDNACRFCYLDPTPRATTGMAYRGVDRVRGNGMDTTTTGGTVQAQTIERASRDPVFRQNLLSDPTGTLEREFGVSMPAGTRITVVEETPNTVYLVLPSAPSAADEELSGDELDAVAGGGCAKSISD